MVLFQVMYLWSFALLLQYYTLEVTCLLHLWSGSGKAHLLTLYTTGYCNRNLQEEYWGTHLRTAWFLSPLFPWLVESLSATIMVHKSLGLQDRLSWYSMYMLIYFSTVVMSKKIWVRKPLIQCLILIVNVLHEEDVFCSDGPGIQWSQPDSYSWLESMNLHHQNSLWWIDFLWTRAIFENVKQNLSQIMRVEAQTHLAHQIFHEKRIGVRRSTWVSWVKHDWSVSKQQCPTGVSK